jgi:hypothetical protein
VALCILWYWVPLLSNESYRLLLTTPVTDLFLSNQSLPFPPSPLVPPLKCASLSSIVVACCAAFDA